MAAKMAATETNETKFEALRYKLPPMKHVRQLSFNEEF